MGLRGAAWTCMRAVWELRAASGHGRTQWLVFVLVDEFVIVLIDVLVLVLVQALDYVLFKANVRVLVDQYLQAVKQPSAKWKIWAAWTCYEWSHCCGGFAYLKSYKKNKTKVNKLRLAGHEFGQVSPVPAPPNSDFAIWLARGKVFKFINERFSVWPIKTLLVWTLVASVV